LAVLARSAENFASTFALAWGGRVVFMISRIDKASKLPLSPLHRGRAGIYVRTFPDKPNWLRFGLSLAAARSCVCFISVALCDFHENRSIVDLSFRLQTAAATANGQRCAESPSAQSGEWWRRSGQMPPPDKMITSITRAASPSEHERSGPPPFSSMSSMVG
jgi:hypothetical protein